MKKHKKKQLNYTSFEIFNFDMNQLMTYRDFKQYRLRGSEKRYIPSLDEFNEYKEICYMFHTYKGEYKTKPNMFTLIQNTKLGDTNSIKFEYEQKFNNECLISVQMCDCCATNVLWFGSQVIGNDSVFVFDNLEIALHNGLNINDNNVSSYLKTQRIN